MRPIIQSRYLAVALLSLASGLLLLSYVVICVHTGSAWPFYEVVHEDGVRTLVGTVLYVEHAARELPLDILLGIAIGGSFLFTRPIRREHRYREVGRTCKGISFAFAAGFVTMVILVGTVYESGWKPLWDNLLQYHTRPGAALVWGAHWRYHLLSRLALILVPLGFVAGLRWLYGGYAGRGMSRGRTVVLGAIAAFLSLTLLFSPDLGTLWLPLFDPIFLGHQAREVVTHGLITLPMTWGICLLRLQPETPPPQGYGWTSVWLGGAGIVGILLGLYVGIGALVTGAASQGQTDDIVMLIFPHVFEHSFSYALVPCVAAWLYAYVGHVGSGVASETGGVAARQYGGNRSPVDTA